MTGPPAGRILRRMTQDEIDEAEWRNPANWRGGLLGVYASRRDSRAFVPKRSRLGITVNFAHRAGIVFLLGVVLFVAILLATRLS